MALPTGVPMPDLTFGDISASLDLDMSSKAEGGDSYNAFGSVASGGGRIGNIGVFKIVLIAGLAMLAIKMLKK